MCIIAVKEIGVPMFPEETIRQMFNRNHDGAGYMYFDKELGKVKCNKGFMTVESLLDDLKTKDFTDTNLVLHFRIGTSGLMDGLNCHPYPVYEPNAVEFETDLAVAHNGILSNFTPPYGAKYNDTQNFIKKVLSIQDKGFLDNEGSIALLEAAIKGNRLCFLDDKNEVTLVGDGWIKDGDYHYSNSSYKPYIAPKPTQPYNYHYGSKSMFSIFDYDYSSKPSIHDELDDELIDEGCMVKYFNDIEELQSFLQKLEMVDEDLYTDESGFYYEPDYESLLVVVSL